METKFVHLNFKVLKGRHSLLTESGGNTTGGIDRGDDLAFESSLKCCLAIIRLGQQKEIEGEESQSIEEVGLGNHSGRKLLCMVMSN